MVYIVQGRLLFLQVPSLGRPFEAIFCLFFCSISSDSWIGTTTLSCPLALAVQHALDIINPFPLLRRTPLGRKTRRHRHLVRALPPQLVEPPPLLQVGDAPLLEVLDPLSGAVAVEVPGLFVAKGGGPLLGVGGPVEGVVDALGVEAGEVGVAGGPADLALCAGGDGVTGADSVCAGVLGCEGPDHCSCLSLVSFSLSLIVLSWTGSVSGAGGVDGSQQSRDWSVCTLRALGLICG